MNIPQKSPNWDKRNQLKGHFIEAGYPFQEGFPEHHYGATFTLIGRDGREHKGAQVDASKQHAEEGLCWRRSDGQTIYPNIVICWIEEIPVEKSSP